MFSLTGPKLIGVRRLAAMVRAAAASVKLDWD